MKILSIYTPRAAREMLGYETGEIGWVPIPGHNDVGTEGLAVVTQLDGVRGVIDAVELQGIEQATQGNFVLSVAVLAPRHIKVMLQRLKCRLLVLSNTVLHTIPVAVVSSPCPTLRACGGIDN